MKIGQNIKRLRIHAGLTQEQLAERLHLSGQAVSKWENETALPDIALLPSLADCFGVTIDELMDYKLRTLTYKERFVKFMVANGVMKDLESGGQAYSPFYLNFEHLNTNAQIDQIGEFFADCIRDNHIEFNTILGLAYHGVAFSVATACALLRKYGVVVNYCHDRKVPDSRGRELCGYTLRDGDKVVIVNDIIVYGKTLSERLDNITRMANVEIAAVVVIADRMRKPYTEELVGSRLIEEKYHTKVYSIITEADIEHAIQNRII